MHPTPADARGLADSRAIADLIPRTAICMATKPTRIDAGIYGFIANIYFYESNPAEKFVTAHDNICAALPRHSRGGQQ